MRPVCILIATFSISLLPAGCGAGKVVEEEVVERSVEVAPGGRLAIVNVNGDISVNSWDRHEVKMKAVKRARAESEDEARRLLEKSTGAVRPDRAGDRYPHGRTQKARKEPERQRRLYS